MNCSGGSGGGGRGWWPWNWHGDSDHNDDYDGLIHKAFLHFIFLCLLLSLPLLLPTEWALALGRPRNVVLWEVARGMYRKPLPSAADVDVFVPSSTHAHWEEQKQELLRLSACWHWLRASAAGLLLPQGYPHSVSPDYMAYSLWRGAQGIASQVSAVLSTQALLYAIGLGKGAIPTAAAINWILKDGIGYLSKILLSKFGRHFDVNPKGWRLFSDLLENAAYGMEILTPLFPHHFVFIGAAAGAGRSAAALIQVPFPLLFLQFSSTSL